MTRILLVDDDVELVSLIRDYLQQDGFVVDSAHDGEAGVTKALLGHCDIVVLDVMMPRLSGIDVLRRFRQSSQVPVLMLTARGDDMDRIIGLELGADDYVPKPCLPRELAARIRAILRRTRPKVVSDGQEMLEVGPLTVYPQRRAVQWRGVAVDLTSTEYNLLEVLARQAGRPVSKQELSEKGLGRPLARFDRSIDVHLSSIRHKLGTLADGRHCIQTVFRQGYQLLRE